MASAAAGSTVRPSYMSAHYDFVYMLIRSRRETHNELLYRQNLSSKGIPFEEARRRILRFQQQPRRNAVSIRPTKNDNDDDDAKDLDHKYRKQGTVFASRIRETYYRYDDDVVSTCLKSIYIYILSNDITSGEPSRYFCHCRSCG
jgi:hypothetical protein